MTKVAQSPGASPTSLAPTAPGVRKQLPTRKQCLNARIESPLYHVKLDLERAPRLDRFYCVHGADQQNKGWGPFKATWADLMASTVRDEDLAKPIIMSAFPQAIIRREVALANTTVINLLEPISSKSVAYGIRAMDEKADESAQASTNFRRWSAVALISGLTLGLNAALSFMGGRSAAETVVSAAGFAIATSLAPLLLKRSSTLAKIADGAIKAGDVLKFFVYSHGFAAMPPRVVGKSAAPPTVPADNPKPVDLTPKDTIKAQDTEVERRAKAKQQKKIDWDPEGELKT